MFFHKSTNVRIHTWHLRPLMTRAGFVAAERVAPSAGAAVAARLWFTVPTTTAYTRRSRATLPTGTAFTADVDSRTVRGTSWGTGDLVYLVHGWGGWGNQLEAMVPPLLEAGLKVVTFDALSHGDSDSGRDGPRSTAVPEMVESLRAVVSRQGPARAIVAHSLGAMTTAAALRDGLAADRVVFVALAGSFEPTADAFGARLGFGPRVRARLMARVERRVRRRYGETLVRFDVPAIADVLAAQGRDPDLLVVHDHADPETPFTAAVAISEAWPRSTLVATTGLGHRRILRDPRVVAQVCDFVAGGRSPAAAEAPGLLRPVARPVVPCTGVRRSATAEPRGA